MAWWKVQAAKKSERPEPSPQSPSPQNPSLPYDILLLIAELLDEQRLGRLIQTCRQLQILVEPILYRHIRVLRNRGWPAQNPLKSHFLHRTLVGRPDLLPVIRSYHGPLIPTANDAESITSSGPSKGVALWPFWHKTGTATRKPGLNDLDFVKRAKIIFSGATNIRELHFTDTIAKDTTQVFSALGAPRGSKTTNIQSLVLRIGIDSPQLTPILRMQPRLRHLELQLESYVPVRLDGTVLPELESLKAELRHAAEIVPGRPVKKLELLNDWTSYKDSLQRLALSTCGITEFITHITFLGTDYTIPDILIAPARYLQGIERLCFRLRGRAFGRTLLEALPEYSSLSHLKLVGVFGHKEEVLTFSHEWFPPIPYSRAEFMRFAERLKERCPALVEAEWCRSAMNFCCSWEGEDSVKYRISQ